MILTATHIPTGETTQFELSRESFSLGRASSGDSPDKLSVAFDPKLSRRTALLAVAHDSITVTRDGSRYPLFYEGCEKDQFQVRPGERFSSGETVFELIQADARTLTVQVMDEVNHGNAETTLKVLLGFQPLLGSWHTVTELAEKSVGLLRELLPYSQVTFFQLEESGEAQPLAPTTLRPSRSLMAECLKENLPAYHVWAPTGGENQPTQFGDESWALAAPVVSTKNCLILYAVGQESQNTPGVLERSALALVARILGQHLESRHSLFLTAKIEAETRANTKLRILLETIEQSLSLEQESGFQKRILEGARKLTDSELAHFELDLSEFGEEKSHTTIGQDNEGYFLAGSFERSWPQGVLCRRKQDEFSDEEAGWLEALVGFAETVFENRRLHNQVSLSLDRLKESQAQTIRASQWAAAGRLAANAAHELNTPLGAIKLSAETAVSFLRDPAKPVTDSLGLILRSVERCKKVTERLLIYSRPNEKKLDEVFQVSNVVEDSIESLSPFLKGKSIEWKCEVPPDLKARGNIQDCYWALTNVLKNAIEELGECNSDGRKLHLSTVQLGKSVLLLIEDSGPGVPPDKQEKIFEPFFSTKKIGQGNGLGLAISRRNVRTWGGDLKVEDSVLGGAKFLLSIPVP